MKNLKIIPIIVLFALVSSCKFGQVQGNGNVQTEERPLTQNFNQVRGSAGIDIILTQGTQNKIVVEADQNLLEIITTTVINGKLKITAEKNIGRASSKKVHVTYKDLNTIEASSGSDIVANNIIKSETIHLDSNSGADIEVEIFAKEVFVETSSGAYIEVSGVANILHAKASSGSGLQAKKLEVLECNARASSGADIVVNVKESIDAKASSGGDLRFYGNPTNVKKHDSSSGSVRKM